MTSMPELVSAAEAEWLRRWTGGPTEKEGSGLPPGTAAPDLALPDDSGRMRQVSEFWSDGPALIMFWRHFGCTCGAERARRLRAEWPAYREAGLTPVIVAQGEPARAAAYRLQHDVPCRLLCDPDHDAYRAYGIGQWPVERVLHDAPAEFWNHSADTGRRFQDARRAAGRAPVDDPWRATGEVVVGPGGRVRLTYVYQYCSDYPDARVLTTAARLSATHAVTNADVRRS